MNFLSLDRLHLIEFFEKHFDNKRAAIVCLFIAILNKSLIAWLYTDLEGDKSLYLLFAKTILDGNHPLEPLGIINGVENYFYNGGIISPLYSLLAVPLLWITKSYHSTSFLLDVLSWSLFLTGVYRFSLLIVRGRWISNLLVLCAGFFLYPHELQSGPKDTLSIGLLLWICTALVHFYYKPVSLRKSLLLCLLIISLGLAKFLYAPLSFIFLLMVWAITVKAKSKAHLRNAVFITVISGLAAVSFLAYLDYLKELDRSIAIEKPIAKPDMVKGFSPGNLTSFFPFISSSLINVNFWCTQLTDILKTAYGNIVRAFQIIDVLLLIPLILLIKSFISKSTEKLPWQIGITISVVIIGLLFFMSASYKPTFYEGGSKWTYVTEARSYLFLIVFLQSVLFYIIFRSNVQVLLKNFLLLLFLIECLHGFYFTAKQLIAINTTEQSVNSPVKKVNQFLITANTTAPVALSTRHGHLRQYALLHNLPVVYYSNSVCKVLHEAKGHSLLIVNFEKDSSTLDGCDSQRRLITTDTVPPYILKLYSK